MRCLWIMFVTAVCFLFLLKLKWPKNKNILNHVVSIFTYCFACFGGIEWSQTLGQLHGDCNNTFYTSVVFFLGRKLRNFSAFFIFCFQGPLFLPGEPGASWNPLINYWRYSVSLKSLLDWTKQRGVKPLSQEFDYLSNHKNQEPVKINRQCKADATWKA